MSLRQFYPRRNNRRQVSARKLLALYATLTIAIGLQISYPLINGESLRLVTIATVYWAAAAMIIHALLAYGITYTSIFVSVTFFYALTIEQIGSRTGWPFGHYQYSGSLGYQIYGVPLVVPFAWIMIAHPILIAARKVTKNWVFLYGGFGMMAWDLFLDPQMVDAERWVYCNDMQIEQILTMNLLHHVFNRSANEVPYLLFYDSKSQILHVAIHCN